MQPVQGLPLLYLCRTVRVYILGRACTDSWTSRTAPSMPTLKVMNAKSVTLSALLTMWVFWHLRKFRTQYNSLASCYKKRKLTDCKTPPTPVLFFKWRIGFLVRLEIMCWKKQIFFPPAGKERDITHFYAASMAKGKKSVNLFFSLITRGEVENQYHSDKNVITW